MGSRSTKREVARAYWFESNSRDGGYLSWCFEKEGSNAADPAVKDSLSTEGH